MPGAAGAQKVSDRLEPTREVSRCVTTEGDELLVKADASFPGELPHIAPANFSWFQTSANGSLLTTKSSADMSAQCTNTFSFATGGHTDSQVGPR
jgi:hypothetical protein